MSTLPIRSLHVPQALPLPGFARLVSYLSSVIEAFSEAQEMARVAHKRYPFAEG